MAVSLPEPAFSELVLFPTGPEIVERIVPTSSTGTPTASALQVVRCLTDRPVTICGMTPDSLTIELAAPIASGVKAAWEALAQVHSGGTRANQRYGFEGGTQPMTTVLVHELPEQSQTLLMRLQSVLASRQGPLAASLLARAQVMPREKPRMVLTGQFSSGKSKLITALTDRAVEPPSAADIATDTVTTYPWDGAVVLVDTPGVQSGLRNHDDLALSAIGDADFILFVIHVGLFDDASREFLRHLANDLQLFGQMIVVITQTGKQSAAPGVREHAVQDALGTVTFNVPMARSTGLLPAEPRRRAESGTAPRPIGHR